MNDKPRKVDYVEKVKLRVGDLRLGMYVCELDRPWLETPFLFQGFELKQEEDIDAVKRYCEYVYIDLLRTRAVRVTVDSMPARSFLNDNRLASFEKEIEVAEATRKRTSNLVMTFMDQIRFGSSVDIQTAKGAVSDCVASILRNPDAMMFMTQLRDKDAYASQHSFNVCIYSIILGRYAGLDTKELENLGTCGLLHDMGKVAIPDEILNKPGSLSQEEFAVMQQHTTQGRDILMSGRNLFSGTVDVAYGHHENLDGSGYPRGMQGHQLNQNCKIVAVVDKYDAITSDRPHRSARDHLDAVSILNKLVKENQVDGYLTAGFVAYLGIFPPGSVVELSTGEVAIILQSNPKQRLRPQILVVRDAEKNQVERWVDMAEKLTDERGRPYRITAVRHSDDFGINLSQYQNAIMQAFG